MAVTPTTRWQVNGYRFLVRRMEHALVRRDVRMLHDPMRSQSRALAVGVVIASLGLAGCAALALFRPQDKIGDELQRGSLKPRKLYSQIGHWISRSIPDQLGGEGEITAAALTASC